MTADISGNTIDTQAAVLWDLDGTLIDSAEDHFLTWHEALSNAGYDITRQQLIELIGMRNDAFLKIIVSSDLPADESRCISDEKEELYRAIVRERGVTFFPGAADWLRKVALRHPDWQQIIASSAPPGNIRTVMENSILGELIESYISAGEVKNGKPAPDVFIEAAQRLSIAPERCIVVEDAHVGLKAATAAGMGTVAVRTTHPDVEGDITVENLTFLRESDLEKLLLAQRNGVPTEDD